MKSFNRISRRGFTLIELLVVIAIIALLVSILLPSLNRAKQLAKVVVCASQLRNVGMANQFYVTDYQGYHVPAWAKGGQYWPGSGAYWYDISGFRELMNVSLLADLSSAPWQSSRSSSDCVSGYYPKQFLCPDATRALTNFDNYPVPDGFAYFGQSYGMNMSSEKQHIYYPTYYSSNDWITGIQSTRQENPSGTIHFLDCLSTYNPYGGHDLAVAVEGEFSWYYNENQTLGWGGGGGSNWAWRHPNNSANIMFFDGHVEQRGRDEVVLFDDSAIQKMWDTQMSTWQY